MLICYLDITSLYSNNICPAVQVLLFSFTMWAFLLAHILFHFNQSLLIFLPAAMAPLLWCYCSWCVLFFMSIRSVWERGCADCTWPTWITVNQTRTQAQWKHRPLVYCTILSATGRKVRNLAAEGTETEWMSRSVDVRPAHSSCRFLF